MQPLEGERDPHKVKALIRGLMLPLLGRRGGGETVQHYKKKGRNRVGGGHKTPREIKTKRLTQCCLRNYRKKNFPTMGRGGGRGTGNKWGAN